MKEIKKFDFDLWILSLRELIEVYNDITDFIKFLDDSVLEIEEENNE